MYLSNIYIINVVRRFLIAIISVSIFALAFIPADAKVTTVSKAAKIRVGTKVSGNNLNLTFSNLGNAKKISYQLTYTRTGGSEGVEGAVGFKGKGPITKVITLGTCSAKKCVYHRNVKNIKVKIVTTYSGGKSETQFYFVK